MTPYTIIYEQTESGLIRATLQDNGRSFSGYADKTEDGALSALARRLSVYPMAFDPSRFPNDLKSRYLLT